VNTKYFFWNVNAVCLRYPQDMDKLQAADTHILETKVDSPVPTEVCIVLRSVVALPDLVSVVTKDRLLRLARIS